MSGSIPSCRKAASRLRSATAAVVVAALAWPAPARAADGEGAIYSGVASAMVLAARTVELSIPDIRWERAGGDNDWVFSWPIAFGGPRWAIGEHHGLSLTPFAEIQQHRGDDLLRVGAGVRLALYDRRPDWQWAPLLELGGLAGEDGRGGFVGAGIGYGLPEIGVTFGVIGRRVWTDEGARSDLALDFQIPLALSD